MRLCTLLLTIFFFNSAISYAADGGNASNELPDADNEFDKYNGLIIDSIEIDNRNIYDTNKPRYDNIIFRSANRLHWTSRQSVIKRELLIRKGDTFSAELAEETARNLRTRLTLYNAWIEVTKLPGDHLFIKVITIDQWSLSGGLQFEREGDDTRYRLWVEEKNLLGRNVLLSAENVIQDAEEDYFAVRHLVKRVRGQPLSFMVEYSGNPQNSFDRINLSRPYYNLEQKTSFVLDLKNFGGRYDLYRDEIRISETEFEGDQARAGFEYRVGSYRKRITYAYLHNYRFSETQEPDILSNFTQDSALALAESPVDSVYHVDNVSVMLSRSEFWKTERIEGFGYYEDYLLGQTASLGFGRAFDPGYSSYRYDRLRLLLSHRVKISSSLISFDYTRSIWFKKGRELRRLSQFTIRYYNNSLKYFTFAFRGRYLADHSKDISNPLTLGGRSGLRGFDSFFKTGDRLFTGNIEGRFFTDLRLMSLVIGGVVFTDFGRIWKNDEDFQFEDFYTGIGIGLRIHFERAARGRVLRTDLSYARETGWQISVGTGQYFHAATVSL